jgi:hypothetical protein
VDRLSEEAQTRYYLFGRVTAGQLTIESWQCKNTQLEMQEFPLAEIIGRTGIAALGSS